MIDGNTKLIPHIGFPMESATPDGLRAVTKVAY
jgi:hypothetical protein